MSIAAGDRLVDKIRPIASSTRRREVVGGIGGFAGAVRLPRGFRRPLIVTSTDGVGTKLRIAFQLRRHDTVGIDLVAMNVNDILTIGAEPLAFLDYFATGRLRPRVAEAVIRGIGEGCRQAGCALVGGETAEMPSFYADGEYDVAGFVVGIVEESRIIDGRTIQPGDAVLGLASTGLHSNGFSLVRKVLEEARISLSARPRGLGAAVGKTLLTPTRIYSRAVRALTRGRAVKGMAHITGGGLPGNLARILPPSCDAAITLGRWPVPPVFDWLREAGRIRPAEMFRTFNMGVGYVVVVAAKDAAAALAALGRAGQPAYHIGEIVKGRGRVRLVGA